MKIAIFRGHNTIYNTGAVGIRKEDDLINEVAFKLLDKLKNFSLDVIDCTPTEAEFKNIKSTTDSLSLRCKKANTANVDLVVSIHFNAYNGQAHGTEVLYVSEKGKEIAQPIQNEIVKLGYTNRGVKKRTDLYVLNYTIAPAILIECCFCDSKTDMELYDSDKIATAIVQGLLQVQGKFILTEPTATKSQIDEWAEERFLDSSYKELLDIYWTECIAKEINPVIPFAQMCYETGFLYKIPSTAGIDASYHNPCGLKISQGGSDTSSSAHKKFKDWSEGITAHLDHLSLYLGLEGYPKTYSPDPRHFSWLKGKVKVVEDLGKTWTNSSTYSDTLLKFISEIENTVVEQNDCCEQLKELKVNYSKLEVQIKTLLQEQDNLKKQNQALKTENENLIFLANKYKTLLIELARYVKEKTDILN